MPELPPQGTTPVRLQHWKHMSGRLAFIDLETLGGGVDSEIIEFACVLVDDGEISDQISILIDPKQPIPGRIQKLTGIRNHDVAGQRQFHEVASDILSYLNGRVLVGHNCAFDYGCLNHHLSKLGRPLESAYYCTLEAIQREYPNWEKFNLKACCEALSVDQVTFHRALDDSLACLEVYRHLEKLGQGIVNDPALDISYPTESGIFLVRHLDKILYVGESANLRIAVPSVIRDVLHRAKLRRQDLELVFIEEPRLVHRRLRWRRYVSIFSPSMNPSGHQKFWQAKGKKIIRVNGNESSGRVFTSRDQVMAVVAKRPSDSKGGALEHWKKGRFIFQLPGDSGAIYVDGDKWAHAHGKEQTIYQWNHAGPELAEIYHLAWKAASRPGGLGHVHPNEA